MNMGRTLFAQVMEFVPWKTFGRVIQRRHGNAGVRTLNCRVMAFAQLTWRESLRDIEVCLTANRAKLFHMGLKNEPARSTLSDALNLRDWRIYHDLAMRMITPEACTPTSAWTAIWMRASTPWMPRPSTCALRCSTGRRFAPPRRSSNCTRCWTCAVPFPPLSRNTSQATDLYLVFYAGCSIATIFIPSFSARMASWRRTRWR